ncbi:MAG: OmpA family protein [Thermonemataceae bacterium]
MKTGHLLILIFLISTTLQAQEKQTILEEFDNAARGWPVNKATFFSSYVEEGAYHIVNKYPSINRYCFISLPIQPQKDYSIEAKITQVEGPPQKGYGILWNHAYMKNSLAFQLNAKKEASLYEKSNNEERYLKEWFALPKQVGKDLNTPNVLRIEKTAQKVVYYVNGEAVLSGKVPQRFGKYVGFRVEGGVTIKVDYLKVVASQLSIQLLEDTSKKYTLENLGANINSAYTEKAPQISIDGQRLYICRARHPDNFTKSDDIWFSDQDEKGAWQPAQLEEAPLNNTGFNCVISIAPDRNTLLLANTYRKDGRPLGGGVSLSRRKEGKWQVPVKQTIKKFTNNARYVNYYLTADGQKLLMAIKNKQSVGGMDLFISFLEKNDTWSEPVSMGKVLNTYADEISPFLAADNETLYFSSYGHPGYGSADIFVSKRLDDTWQNWSEPKNLGPSINTPYWDAYYTITAKGDYAYLVSSRSDKGYGGEDIYRVALGEALRPAATALVKGKVFNQATKAPIEAQIYYENLNTGKQLGKASSTTDLGYTIALPRGQNYGFRAEAAGFYPISENIRLDTLKSYQEKEVNLYLVPIEKGQTIRLNNLFFDVDKATLREESYPELNRLTQWLKSTPEAKIEITGHTDSQGTEAYNLTLSDNRAKTVSNYLQEQGVAASRLSYKGYGERKPVADNQSAAGRQRNRRVEFVIQ